MADATDGWIRDAPSFDAARLAWFQGVVGRLASVRPKRLESLSDWSDPDYAMAVIHVGVGHLLGEFDESLTLGGLLEPSQVISMVQLWRSGRVDVDLAKYPKAAWLSLYLLGRDFEQLSPAMLEAISDSGVADHMRGQTHHDLRAKPASSPLSEYLSELFSSGEVLPARDKLSPLRMLDVPGSHLAALARIGNRDRKGLDSLLWTSALEMALVYVDPREDALKTLCQTAITQWIEIYLQVEGAWPGSCAPNEPVPPWLADIVIQQNGRSAIGTTGYVPEVAIVAESHRELAAIRRWSYNPALGFGFDEDLFVLQIPLPDKDGEASGEAFSFFHNADAPTLRQLGALFATGCLRVDAYLIGPDDHLSHQFSVSVDLSPEMSLLLENFLRKHQTWLEMGAGEAMARMRDWPSPSEADLARALLAERSRFEGISYRRMAVLPPSVVDAFDRLMSAYDADGRARRSGRPAFPDVLAEAREEYQEAVATLGFEGALPVEVLDAGRAVVYVNVTSGFLDAVAAWVDESGSATGQRVDCSVTHALEDVGSFEELVAWLTDALRPLGSLRDRGVTSLVLSPASSLRSLPLHEALLRIGFEEVSYCHNLRALVDLDRALPSSGNLVLTYASQGADYLRSVDAEQDLVTKLLGSHSSEPSSGAYECIHLAGHGFVGPHVGAVGINLDPAQDLLSGAWVLRNMDLAGTQLVVLSACATGVPGSRPGQVEEQAGLDSCFVAAGARVVVSTTEPVNDVIAFVFVAVLHSARAAGAPIWESYILAREAARSGLLPSDLKSLDADCADVWPEWRSTFTKALHIAPDDWCKFTVSGRHW